MTESNKTDADEQPMTAAELEAKIRACSAEVERLTADMKDDFDNLVVRERVNAWAAMAAEGADPDIAQSLRDNVAGGVAHRATFHMIVDLHIHDLTAAFAKMYAFQGRLDRLLGRPLVSDRALLAINRESLGALEELADAARERAELVGLTSLAGKARVRDLGA